MKRGFSLIEMVVVIVLAGIIALVALQRASVAAAMRSRLAANELMVNLRHVRATATQRERTMRVSFDVPASSYAVDVCDSGAPGGFAPAKNPADQKDWMVFISERFSGVTLADVDMDGGHVLFFNGTNGAPSGAGGVELSAPGKIVFDTGLTVTIAPGTGYIEIAP